MKRQPLPNYYRRTWGTFFLFLGIAIILFYTNTLTGMILLLTGSFLYVEHIYQWGFQFWDFIGHEYFGLILILISMFLAQSQALYGLIGIVLSLIIVLNFDKARATNTLFVWRKK